MTVVKMITIGESEVGKTSLLVRFFENRTYLGITSIGVDFKIKHVERIINGADTLVKVQVWDTAGQEKFRSIIPRAFRDIQKPTENPAPMGIIICYDVTDRRSYNEAVGHWIEQADACCALNAVTCLVGNKIDLDDQRAVSQKEVQALAQEIGIQHVFETSAKTGANVEDMFNQIVDAVLKRQEEEAANAPDEESFGGRAKPLPPISSPAKPLPWWRICGRRRTELIQVVECT